mmetsp:Transcript_4616/g.8192  ORF Transcript_4616/g.8192 Transcript_4616/m.8192 type:complete len:320 (-) Transcript_4616:199-1158(-)
MSLRRSSRRSSGDSAAGHGRKFFVGDGMEVTESFGRTEGGQDTVDKSNYGRTNIASEKVSTNDKSNSSARPTRLFVGDSVEFCPIFTHTKAASKRLHSTIEDVKEAAASLAPDSVLTTRTASTDSIVSGSTSSSTDSKRPKQKAPLASETNEEEPPNKKGRPLFKRKLNIKLNAVRKEDSESKTVSSNTNAKDCKNKVNANDENEHWIIQKPCKSDDGQITIQQLLSLRNKRSLQAQSNLTFSQLKQQARQKAKANSKSTRRVKPKRRKKCKNSRNQKRSPASSNESGTPEPMDKVEMNTGTLYLYRGENPRAKFIRRK